MTASFWLQYTDMTDSQVLVEVRDVRIVAAPDPVTRGPAISAPTADLPATTRPPGARRDYTTDLDSPVPDAHGNPIPVGAIVRQTKNGWLWRVTRTYPRVDGPRVGVIVVGTPAPGQKTTPNQRQPRHLEVLSAAEVAALGLDKAA